MKKKALQQDRDHWRNLTALALDEMLFVTKYRSPGSTYPEEGLVRKLQNALAFAWNLNPHNFVSPPKGGTICNSCGFPQVVHPS